MARGRDRGSPLAASPWGPCVARPQPSRPAAPDVGKAQKAAAVILRLRGRETQGGCAMIDPGTSHTRAPCSGAHAIRYHRTDTRTRFNCWLRRFQRSVHRLSRQHGHPVLAISGPGLAAARRGCREIIHGRTTNLIAMAAYRRTMWRAFGCPWRIWFLPCRTKNARHGCGINAYVVVDTHVQRHRDSA
jgi:hypothetical protein